MVTLSRQSDREEVSQSSSNGAFPQRFPHSARERAIIAGGLLACLALYLAAIDPALYLWGDNAHYIIVAKSLATGHGLRDIQTPGSPRFPYPVPLFPLALAPIVRVFDYQLVPLKVVVVVFGVLTVYATLRLFLRLMDPTRAVVLTALVAVSPQIVSFSHQVMTELPYLGLSIVALMCVMDCAREDGWNGRETLLAALALAAATLTRTLGVTLILAAAAYVLLDGAGPLGRRAAKAALMCGLCAAVWLAANGTLIAAIPYFAEFRHGTASAQSGASHMGIRSRVAANLVAYAGALPETVYYGYSLRDPAPKLVGAAIILALVLGFAYAAWRKRTALEYYCLAYGAVLLVYEPANSGNLRRYLVPIIPFLLYYFVRGLEALGILLERVRGTRLLAERWWRTATISLLALIGMWNFARTVEASVVHRKPEMFDFYRWGDFRGYQRMATWTRANTPASSVIATRGAYIFHFWSRRQVLWLPTVPPSSSDSVIAATVRQQGIGYVTTDSIAAADSVLFTALARDSRDFARLYEDGRNSVYRVLPGADGVTR